MNLFDSLLQNQTSTFLSDFVEFMETQTISMDHVFLNGQSFLHRGILVLDEPLSFIKTFIDNGGNTKTIDLTGKLAIDYAENITNETERYRVKNLLTGKNNPNRRYNRA
jgi:hypothetical protein